MGRRRRDERHRSSDSDHGRDAGGQHEDPHPHRPPNAHGHGRSQRDRADFLSLLPLSLRMRDFLAQEKTAPLPRPLASGGTPRFTFSAGDIALWPPGPDVVVYYRRGAVPDPGLVLLARLDSGARAFSGPGAVRVRIERVR